MSPIAHDTPPGEYHPGGEYRPGGGYRPGGEYRPGGGYRPGICNIGPAEIARRRRAGTVGIGAAMVLAAGLLLFHAPSAARWLVALPLAGGAVGLLQARLRFCAGYGLAGVRNFGALGSAERVEDAAARRADRAKAAAIILAGGAIGLAGALALVLLPL